MSIAAHLADRSYTLRFLDSAGAPAFRQSPSAPDPEAEEYTGTAGLQSIAESLAAIQLTGPQHAHPHRIPHRQSPPFAGPAAPPAGEDTAGARAAFSGHGRGRRVLRSRVIGGGRSSARPDPARAFDDALMDKLSAHRLRGPVLASWAT